MMKIGRYELAEKLGQGGMGVVYRAFDPLLQRIVAVKLIGALEANVELRERFFREARAAGQLSHKNIITIHDLGEHDGQPFLAMEFLEGQDLQQRMAGHVPMSLARKLELAIEICEGIEYAHQHGVVHRDIKPANIFITTGGRAKILDFGLARLITSELTNSNMMMGTLNYMAPEQVRGERADHRSDIFSTGVVLYEVLGGRKAFEGDSFGATLYKILQEVPEPLPNIDANLPPALVGIVERALEKSRDERYQHMSEMLRDLTAYRQQQMLIDSPAFGRAITGGAGLLSDSDAPIAALRARPLSPVPGRSGSSPAAETVLQATPAAAPWQRLAVPGVAAVILLGALGAWMITRDSAPPTQTAATKADASGLAADQAIASRLEQASEALQSGDQAAAQRHAEVVLAISPGHVEARRIRDRALQTAESVARSLANARASFGSGRFDDASRAAGEVLAVDPDNAEAKRLMDDAAARTRGKGADEARARMARAKNSAVSAGAPTLSPASYAAAISAEGAASRLYEQGRLAEAMAKFWEANGLFRSAEGAAQTEGAVRSERARVAQAEPKAAEPAAPEAVSPKAASQAPLPPAAPVTVGGGLPLPPVQLPIAPPPQAPTAQTLPAETASQRVPTSGINEVLDRYKAALESRSLESLKRLWPSLGGAQESAIRQEFQNASRIDVEIVNPQITVNGTSATVTFIRRYQLQTVDRQRPRTETRTTMNLHRSGATWIIDQMRFEQVR